MKKRTAIITILCLLLAIPATAVFNERSLPRTLTVLRSELLQELNKMKEERAKRWKERNNDAQHQQMVSMVKKCNELSLILYSQNQDYTFDVTYALKEATEEYERFKKDKQPYFANIENLGVEIDRYERLIESLRRMPPALDPIEGIPDSLILAKEQLVNDISFEHRPDSLLTPRQRHIRDSLRNAMGIETQPQSSEQDTSASVIDVSNMVVFGLSIPIIVPTASLSPAKDTVDNRPFILDEQGQIDRDSCLYYARELLKMYRRDRDRTIRDSTHYTEMSDRLKQTYDYAKNRYDAIREDIFIHGQDNFFKVLSTLPSYTSKAIQEARDKYGIGDTPQEQAGLSMSEWRGPVVTGFIIIVLIYLVAATLLSNIAVTIARHKVKKFRTEKFEMQRKCITLLCGVVIFALTIMSAQYFSSQHFLKQACSLMLTIAWLFAAILISILIRIDASKVKYGVRLYLPVVLLGIIITTFRIIFIPNKLVTLVMPLILILFIIWQTAVSKRAQSKLKRGDFIYGWISLAVMVVTCITSMAGYVLLSIQFFVWWLFQLSFIATITAVKDLLDRYEDTTVKRRKVTFRSTHKNIIAGNKGDYISVTWAFDLIRDAAFPIFAILSVPASLLLASNLFDITEMIRELFYKPFFYLNNAEGSQILHISLHKLILTGSLFFIFKYLCYATKATYKQYKFNKVLRQSGREFIRTNEVNLTLANNIISILGWGLYIITAIQILKIPMGAISIVAAGLATGIGLAMKDVLNNFIYGIQLMSGRMRVGDYIECDGVRGKVESISYQSTQIITLEGVLMAITNTTLFNKNFKNLTRNSPYEFVKIVIGVHYGVNVEKTRKILVEALQPLRTKDKYGRDLIEQAHGIYVTFDGFGDNSVDLAVKQFVLVEEENNYIAKAKEIIYNTLNEHNIEIPFPQRDIYVRKFVKDE